MSILPKTSHPLTHLTLPVSKKKVAIRPMTIKDEKIVMMAGSVKQDRLEALKQIVNNCVSTEIDVSKLLFVDFEYLFLMIRAVSVDNQVSISFTRGEEEIKVMLDLRDFKIKNAPENNKLIVNLTEKDGIRLQYPSVAVVQHLTSTPNFDFVNDLIVKCVDQIFIDDQVFDASDPELNELEIIDFIENQPSKVLRDMYEKLFEKAPYLYYEAKVGDEVVEVTDVQDFF